MNAVTRIQLKNGVERVLHVPGNYTTGQILEMALVLDYHMPEPELRERCAQLVDLLKLSSEVFRNVRLNVIKWIDDDHIVKEVGSLPQVRMGRVFDDYGAYGMGSGPGVREEKSFAELARQLKLFYARSKLILVLTDGSFAPGDMAELKAGMHPFLHRKLLIWQGDKVCSGTEWMRQEEKNGHTGNTAEHHCGDAEA